MPTFNLKPSHKNVKAYYKSLDQYERLGATHEGAVREAFQGLIKSCERQFSWTLVPEHSINIGSEKHIVVDGALIDDFLTHGIWEAKDIHDDLEAEVKRKFNAGYPDDNILFQTPERAILWQNATPVIDADLTDQMKLIEILEAFFSFRPPAIDEWHSAVAQFKDQVPSLGHGLAQLIQRERKENKRFINAFGEFFEKCRSSINPNLSEAAVEEMLIQHLLTERIFRTVFKNSDFTRRNVIANEIEKVIDALTSQSFNRRDFLQSLDRFYVAIERTAETIHEFSQKQHFLNTVYERFFQGFSVEVADTHGIVYTPQPIVDFMVRSVQHILKNRFNLALSESGVHIIDPFVGTGNFIVRIMREIRKTALETKYATELHCNEVMLLPYYIASMNIEHELYDSIGSYRPFEGLCLVDTFELAEDHQMMLFSAENAERVELQKKTDMFVVIGNPPYNAGQVNENDNNKNRKYETMDGRIKNTYAKDSVATLKNALYDPYIKAIRWASDRIGDVGIVAFVTNNNLIGGQAFDGMRKHLVEDFYTIYILDLGGNARRGLPVSDANVFGIRVGVSINLFVKSRQATDQSGKRDDAGNSVADSCNSTRVYYHKVNDLWNKSQKLSFLDQHQHIGSLEWQSISPDIRYTWLTKGLHAEFDTFVPMGSKKAKVKSHKVINPSAYPKVIFQSFSGGVNTNRDAWVYNFNRSALIGNVKSMLETYNSEVERWNRREVAAANIDEFVIYDDKKIKWSSGLKEKLTRGETAGFSETKIRRSIYRPFTKSNLYFDRTMIERVLVFPSIFPTPETEMENRVIWLKVGQDWPTFALMINMIPDRLPQSGSQCFPFYIYNEDGTNRRDNISDWALRRFQSHYRDDTITKWDVFYYVYGVLSHPGYLNRYEANLKRDLPHLPYMSEFRPFVEAGEYLSELHVNYENQCEYPLEIIENSEQQLDWRVEKMVLSKDKTLIKYNNFLSLGGIPPGAFKYRLGNRSALEWIIDQYSVKVNARSGIVNDPNRMNDPQYIVKLIAKVVTVSLETLKVVQGLPSLEIRTEGK